MKSIPMTSIVGNLMDLDRYNLIVPVTATRKLQLAGGQAMEQAVPEDYVLSAIIFRAMERREGRDLEFVLKSYLPVVVIPSHEVNRYFLIEQLGLTSESIQEAKSINFTKIKEKVETAITPDELIKCINDIRTEIKKYLECSSTTVVGLFSGLVARGISKIFDRPTHQNLEEYSVSLSDLISKTEFDHSIKMVQNTSIVLSSLENEFVAILEELHPKIDALVNSHKQDADPIISRLDQRVDSLKKQIEALESERYKIAAGKTTDKSSRLAEIDGLLKARRSALERDQQKQSQIVSSLEDEIQSLSVNQDELVAESNTAIKQVRNQLSALTDMSVQARVDESGKRKTAIMVPFFIVGFSRRDQLQIEVYPLSHLNLNGERVGRRRDYVDVFETTSRAIEGLSSIIEERANDDVAFRKFLRDASQDYNLLADSDARESIRNGAESLLGDGLAKRPLVEELDNMLKSIPEIKSRRKRRRAITPVMTDASMCPVKFHFHDDAGNPIVRAELEIGALIVESDDLGIAAVDLPKSQYDGIARASGYIEKSVEFSLTSTDEVVIPITLTPLSHEEQLSLQLDELVERARRLDMIRERLWQAFEKQGDTLLGIPAYRNALHELLTELGYEPEAWITEAKAKTGMVKRLLKRDDRADGLRRDILRMAEESKKFGGIMLFSELLVRLDNLGWSTGSEEIENIINDMAKEGLIQGLSPLESGSLIVEFVPVALTDDPQYILDLAAQKSGKLTMEDAVIDLEWTEERVRNALNLLIANGVAKEQRSYSKSTQYFFPGLIGGKK